MHAPAQRQATLDFQAITPERHFTQNHTVVFICFRDLNVEDEYSTDVRRRGKQCCGLASGIRLA